MSKINQPHIYDEKIQNYERIFIQYVVEAGKYKRRSDRESHILAYLVLHPKLTQEQIADLADMYYRKGHRKGISSGKISQILNYIKEKLEIIKVEKVKHEKDSTIYYTNEYSLKGDITQILSQTGEEMSIKYFADAIAFFKQRLKNLETINKKSIEKSHHFIRELLIKRIKKMISYLHEHGNIITRDFYKIEEDIISMQAESLASKYNSYSSSIKEIENEIIDYILDSLFFILQKPTCNPIMAYLLTRKKLTQDDLIDLTGLSRGHISQCLNYFLEEGFIQASKNKNDPEDRKIYYNMESIAYFNYSRFLKRLEVLLQWMPKLVEMQEELLSRRAELEHLDGYERFLELLSKYIGLFPMIKGTSEIFINYLNKHDPSKI